MSHLNVEIKARSNQPDRIRSYLLSQRADFRGTDEQTDTYFRVAHGRLKLREGNIENNLIFYERENSAGPKDSRFQLLKMTDPAGLREMLTRSIGIKVIVKKKREIYYLGNVKFHIDEVPQLGSFVEIEAGNIGVNLSQAQLKEQCDFYIDAFGIRNEDMIDVSYSDLLDGGGGD